MGGDFKVLHYTELLAELNFGPWFLPGEWVREAKSSP
jgi:hypothetical protein